MMFMMWLCGVVVSVLEVETFTFPFFRTAWLSAGAESQVDFRWEKRLELPIPFKEREERLGIWL